MGQKYHYDVRRLLSNHIKLYLPTVKDGVNRSSLSIPYTFKVTLYSVQSYTYCDFFFNSHMHL